MIFKDSDNMETVFESNNIKYVKLSYDLIDDYLKMINDVSIKSLVSKKYYEITYDEEGKFNLYGASLDSEGRLREVEDVDMDDVFDMMINRYRESILKGEI